MAEIEHIQETLGYVFKKPAWLYEAITHRSYSQTESETVSPHNERLEFLGDAVLGLVVSERVAAIFPHSTEGELSKVKASLVSRFTLAKAAGRMGLGQWLRLGRGEEVTHGREKTSLLANALEALIGAVYLDGGLEASRTFIQTILATELSESQSGCQSTVSWDCKSQLQEWTHKHFNTDPQYRMIRESGPDHHKMFEVAVQVQGKVLGRGEGRTKKEAEQQAAKQAMGQAQL